MLTNHGQQSLHPGWRGGTALVLIALASAPYIRYRGAVQMGGSSPPPPPPLLPDILLKAAARHGICSQDRIYFCTFIGASFTDELVKIIHFQIFVFLDTPAKWFLGLKNQSVIPI